MVRTRSCCVAVIVVGDVCKFAHDKEEEECFAAHDLLVSRLLSGLWICDAMSLVMSVSSHRFLELRMAAESGLLW